MWLWEECTSNLLWCTGQAGIALEVLGAAWLVVCAIAASRKAKQLPGDPEMLDGMGPAAKLAIRQIRSQPRVQIIGFTLLAIGLVMQFVGGFAA
jgi:hypothetical protein